MIRTLLIVTGASLILAIAAGAGALALGGRDMARHGWAWTFKDNDGDTVSFERVRRDDLGPEATRQLAWTGGDRLTVDLAGEVIYVQGEEAGVTVSGPQALIDRVQLTGGRLSMADAEGPRRERVTYSWDRDGLRMDSDDLRIVVTAPAVRTFEVRGSADVSIRAYDQPTLAIDVSGSAQVEAAGKAAQVGIEISGSGDVDLEALETADAVIDISGSGDARVGPTQSAAVDISGSGDVSLTRRPARLTQDISGSGDVDFH